MQDDLPETIGNEVRRVRLARGETMREVAARAGISQPLLSRVEHGQLLPSLTTVFRLAEALEIAVSSLLPRISSATDAPLHLADGGDALRATLIMGGAGAPLQVNLITGDAGDFDATAFRHLGHEFAYVVEGAAAVHIGERRTELRAGESIDYPATTPHRWSAVEDARVLLVCTA